MNRETAIEIPEAEALEALRQELREERKTHWTASASAKHGIKSDPFRQLERAGQLNAEFFLAEASRIMAKTSTLSASQRAYISDVIDRPVSRVLSQRAAVAADKAAQKPKATKVRKPTTTNKKPAKSNKTAAKSNKTAAKSNKSTTKSNTKK